MESDQQYHIEDIVSNEDKINIEEFFKLIFNNGVQIYRYVDNMKNVDWDTIGKQIGRTGQECKQQYQYLLNTLFQRQQFSDEDRIKLYHIVISNTKSDHFQKLYKQFQESKANQSFHQVSNDMLKMLQDDYFSQYSIDVIQQEIHALLHNLYSRNDIGYSPNMQTQSIT